MKEPELIGRKQIFASRDESILKILEKAMPIHDRNAEKIRYLQEYKRGNQPIKDRVKTIRGDINHRILENHAKEIIDFKVGYECGSPIALVHRNKQNGDEKTDDSNITKLNEMLFGERIASKDRSLYETKCTCGVAYRMVLPRKGFIELAPFELINLDPTQTFVIRSNDIYKEPMLGVTFIDDSEGKRIFTVYSASYVWEIIRDKKLKVLSISANTIGKQPIIEYRNNDDYLGSFESVIGLLNALNVLTSDRLNDISQFVQNILWLNNCEIDDDSYDELLIKGLVQTISKPGMQADIRYLTQTLDQSGIQTYADYIYKQMLQIVGVPGRERSSGGNTGDAIKLSDGWQIAEENAKSSELIFGESRTEELMVILQIISTIKVNGETLNIKLSDIDIKPNRNKTANLLVKTQGLLNMLQAGVHPRIAISHCDLFSDPQQVYIDSETSGFLKKWKEEETIGIEGTSQQVRAGQTDTE